jgi:hypothetical protein
MFSKLLAKLYKALPQREKIYPTIKLDAVTIPEAFGMPEVDFSILTNELTHALNEDDRVGSFHKYVVAPNFQKFGLDVSNPKDAMILGYAFCTSVMLRRQLNKEKVVSDVLKQFHPELKNELPN